MCESDKGLVEVTPVPVQQQGELPFGGVKQADAGIDTSFPGQDVKAVREHFNPDGEGQD